MTGTVRYLQNLYSKQQNSKKPAAAVCGGHLRVILGLAFPVQNFQAKDALLIIFSAGSIRLPTDMKAVFVYLFQIHTGFRHSRFLS